MTDSTSKLEIKAPISSKKSKLQPKPVMQPDDGVEITNMKRKTENSSHNTKVSTSKKLEVTFSEEVSEIENKENEVANECSPSHISPSKQSLKSVKEHIKTPFSKVKEGEEEGSPLNRSLVKNAISGKKIDLCSQPDFSAEIHAIQSVKKENVSPMVKSALKSAFKVPAEEADRDTAEKKTVCFSELQPEEKCLAEKVDEVVNPEADVDNTESLKAEN
jgi:hypothetical protein